MFGSKGEILYEIGKQRTGQSRPRTELYTSEKTNSIARSEVDREQESRVFWNEEKSR